MSSRTIWVWAILEGEDVEFAKRFRLRSISRGLVHDTVDLSLLVYVRFRGASEMKQER